MCYKDSCITDLRDFYSNPTLGQVSVYGAAKKDTNDHYFIPVYTERN